MAMWLQKIVLTVVAVVPVIVGEIVRVTDDGTAENVFLVAPDPCNDRHELAPLPIAPVPSSDLDVDGEAPLHGC